MGATQDPEDLREVEAFDLLKSIRDMLAASARSAAPPGWRRCAASPSVGTTPALLRVLDCPWPAQLPAARLPSCLRGCWAPLIPLLAWLAAWAVLCRGDHARALQKLGELPFVPTERFRLQLCASGGRRMGRAGCLDSNAGTSSCSTRLLSMPQRMLACKCAIPLSRGSLASTLTLCAATAAGVSSLHPAVADRLPAVLLAAAGALAASGKREQLALVAAFASAVPNCISQAVYQQLNQLQANSGL